MTKILAEEGKPAIDYYLEITPNSKNTSLSGGTVTIYAKKKEGTTIDNVSGNTGIVVKYNTSQEIQASNNKYTYKYLKDDSKEV
jgi:hypothetical protein